MPPTSPPARPVVPVGLATKLGAGAAALAALAAAVAALLDGDHTPETLGALLTAGGLLYGVIRGRMDQAAAAMHPPRTVTPPAVAYPPGIPGAELGGTTLHDPELDDPAAEPLVTVDDLTGRQGSVERTTGHASLRGDDERRI